MKLDAKTITAIGAVVAALAGGAELRLAVASLTDRVQRLDERVQRIERLIEPPRFAHNQ